MNVSESQRQGGFTLVEMAVVLIIIGLIIGAVLKGQDLIENARGKQFANFVRQAEVAAFAFYDRNGRFPGDAFDPTASPVVEPDGIIGNEGVDVEGVRNLSDTITNFEVDKRIGSATYHINYGTFASLDGGTNVLNYPCIVVTKWGGETTANANLDYSDNADQSFWFTDAELEYLKAFDTSIDGLADIRNGKVVGADHLEIYGTSGQQGVVEYNDDGSTLNIFNDSNWTWDGNVSTGADTNPVGLVYFFDRGVINQN